MPENLIQIKFLSGLKQVSLSDLFSEDLDSERSYTIKQSANREIYFHGVSIKNETSLCLSHFHNLDVLIEENKENGAKTNSSLGLKKNSFQKANNFFFIEKIVSLKKSKDLQFVLNRSKDLNSQCDFSSPEVYSLYYFLE
jgi:hypothetical protein